MWYKLYETEKFLETNQFQTITWKNILSVYYKKSFIAIIIINQIKKSNTNYLTETITKFYKGKVL